MLKFLYYCTYKFFRSLPVSQRHAKHSDYTENAALSIILLSLSHIFVVSKLLDIWFGLEHNLVQALVLMVLLYLYLWFTYAYKKKWRKIRIMYDHLPVWSLWVGFIGYMMLPAVSFFISINTFQFYLLLIACYTFMIPLAAWGRFYGAKVYPMSEEEAAAYWAAWEAREKIPDEEV